MQEETDAACLIFVNIKILRNNIARYKTFYILILLLPGNAWSSVYT